MKARIRIRAHGQHPGVERLLDVSVLRLGRGADVDLRGALTPPLHSEITCVDGELHICAQPGRSLEIDGDCVDAAILEPGKTFFVGTAEIRVQRPERDEDVLLEVHEPREDEASAAAARALKRRIRWRIARGPFRPGVLAGAFVAAVLALALWLPAVSGRRDDNERWFVVGRIAPAHAHVANACATCHAAAFRAVADEQCQTQNCHPSIGSHGRPALNARAHAPCDECHREHEGPDALVERSDSFCAACHERPRPEWRLESVSAFVGGEPHKEFRPTVVIDPAEPSVERLPLAAAAENPGLHFSHAKHLAAGLRSRPAPRSRLAGCAPPPPDPAALACETCHQDDARGELKRPVTFKDHCQSCHDLGLDCAWPGFQLSHGAPPEQVRAEIEGFFSAAERNARRAPHPVPPPRDATSRRRTDIDVAPERPETTDERIDRAMEDVLGPDGVCAYCHVVTASGARNQQTIVQQLATVRMVPSEKLPRWLPLAYFSHAPHGPQCESCHAAKAADTSAVVMLPGIAKCRECHGHREKARAEADARCVECHRYHIDRYGPMHATPAVRTASGGELPRS